MDGLADERKIEAQRDIHQRATDDLADAGLDGIHLSFYLTSIYDHSIFEVPTLDYYQCMSVLCVCCVQASSTVCVVCRPLVLCVLCAGL